MSDSDQESYSLDEMMRRLRDRGQSGTENEPQLVTREDGTQVYRVKKRKRRSKQPHKEAETRRRRRTLILVGLLTMVVFLLGIGGLAWVMHLNSSGYEAKVRQSLVDWSGAEVEVTGFRATPVSVGADLLKLSWPNADLKINALSGDVTLDSHLSGRWKGEMLNCAAAELNFFTPDGTARPSSGDEEISFRVPVRAGRMNVKFGKNPDQPAFGLYESRVTLSPGATGIAESRLVIEGGKFSLREWGRFEVGIGSFSYQQGRVGLGTVVIEPEGEVGGEIRLTGKENSPIPLTGGAFEASAIFSQVPSTVLFGKGLGGILGSRFDTPDESDPGLLMMDPTSLDSLRMEGVLACSGRDLVDLRRLPLLTSLVNLLGSPRLSEPRLLLREPIRFERGLDGTCKIAGLDLETAGVLRIQGYLSELPGGALTGLLQVGVHRSLAELGDAGRVERVFREQRDSYYWVPVAISGTVQNPADNLGETIRNGASAATAEGEPEAVEDDFEDLTQPDR
ncbi:MAG: hypothetical protein MUF31_13610 [Akkermansiaceae bacterium]|jgi:hypothetical protein|nr:hypothetical protein [Akkermansiaceae bacterium]